MATPATADAHCKHAPHQPPCGKDAPHQPPCGNKVQAQEKQEAWEEQEWDGRLERVQFKLKDRAAASRVGGPVGAPR
jgi:hypothetical protein